MRISDWSSDVCSSDLRAIQFLRQRLKAPGNLRNLVDAIVALSRALEQLEIVDHDEADVIPPLQPAGAGAQRGDGQAWRIVDEQRQFLQLPRRDRKSTRLNSSHSCATRILSPA